VTAALNDAQRHTRLRKLDLRALGGELITFDRGSVKRAPLPTVKELPLGNVTDLAWPSLERIVVAALPGLVWLDVERGARVRVVERARGPLAVEPGGDRVVGVSGTATLFDGDGNPVRSFETRGLHAKSIVLSSDGQRLLLLTGDGLRVFSVESGEQIAKRGTTNLRAQRAAWLLGGERVIVTTDSGAFAIDPAASRQRPVALDDEEAFAVAVSAAGDVALGSWRDGHLRVRSDGGMERGRWPMAQVRWIAFAGRELVLWSAKHGVIVQPLDGTAARTLLPAARNPTAIALSPDGKAVAIATGETIQIWPLDAEAPRQTLR
jgi:hypothetical protein